MIFINYKKLDKLINHLIKTFPNDFGNRIQVLHYLYIVPDEKKWTNGVIQLPKNFQIKKTLKSIEVDEELKNDNEVFIFPLFNHSIINNIPDDVKSDFLTGAYEIIDYILNAEKYQHNVYNKSNVVNHYDDNIKIIKKIKNNLDIKKISYTFEKNK